MAIFANLTHKTALSKLGQISPLFIALLFLSSVLVTFSPTTEAQEPPFTLSITAQPADLTVTEGEEAAFTVTANGSGTLGYQWFADGAAIPGATTDTLFVSFASIVDDGNVYRVDITDDNGSISSDNATLDVIEVVLPMNYITVNEVLDYDTADFADVDGPGRRFTKVSFMPRFSDELTIELEWDGPENMNLSVFESDTNTKLASDTNVGVNLKKITLSLDANTQYHANAWIESGTASWVMRRVQDIPDPDANISSAMDSAPKPNIVLINTDDQRADTLDRLPAIQQYLSQKGVTYTNAIVPTPSCCPSRATLLSGQYVHNNGQFRQLTENTPIFETTINRYLQQEGYFTGSAGKYLHWVDTDEAPAPYWDRWTNIKGGFYGVDMNFDGDKVKPGGYTTDIVFERTKDYLRDFEARDDDKPWFVYLAPMAPHSPYTAEYDLRNEPVAPYVTNPAYQEADVSDKPGFIQYRTMDDATSRDVFEKRVRSLYSVDREVEQLVQYLEDSGEIANTLIIFTSDNGYLLGEHQSKGKFTPWRNSVQVPLIISWPGQIAENVTNDTYVSHVDISRTILEAVGIDTSELALDGHNIFDETRSQLYMEYFIDPASNSARIETWASTRTSSYQYTEWYDKNDESQVSFREYYDMTNDPYQLNNLLGNTDPNDDPDYTQLSISLETQRTCSGSACTVDEAPVTLSITAQPADLTVTEGEDATFNVIATGSGTLGYQWLANGVAIPGATTDTLFVSFASSADDGNVYRVDITDDNGSISSDNATLDVIEVVLPVTVVNIGQGTLDSDRVAGQRWMRLDFDSLATALHTITVSWDTDADVRFNVFEVNGTRISSNVLQGSNPGIWNGELDANEQYYIGLWSTDGIANYTATVEATVPVSIERQPSGLNVTEGDNANFVVVAAGSGTLSYQWFADGNPLPGETADWLTVFATSLAEDGIGYTVEVSNGFETITSNVATLTVNEPLVLGLFSQEADMSTWMLDGPAPTLDYLAGENTDAWGKTLLRIGDILLVGGDFDGIKPTRNGAVTYRPFLAAFDAVSGQPVSTFQAPYEVDSVVRALALSPDGNQVYVGGDFGLLILDGITGELVLAVSVAKGNNKGRVFDIAVSDTKLYIGGDFSNVDNTYRANIARLSLDGELDSSWSPQVTNGFATGRAAPVQSLTVSPSGSTVYVGGNFSFIDGTPVSTTPQNKRISMLTLSALDGTVQPERFSPNVGNSTKGLTAHDIAVTDFYVIIAWGGPNYVTFHSLDGTLLRQYKGKGDVQALQVVGNHVFVGHHGEFFDFLPNPIPQEALVSLDPEIILPFKLHSFRIDDPSFLSEQAWTLIGPFGVWGIVASEDSIWIAGQISRAGSNDRSVDGLARFPALD